ncbi:MAG: undecaprenyl-diphosphate phosphatase [Flavobacteriales bacterium]
MNFIEAFILGIIQGLTEFLPVSSSGHLELAKSMFNSQALPQESLLFTVILHGATALSTIVVFKDDIMEILKRGLKPEWNENSQYIVKIIISMIPAAFVGVFFKEEIETLFSGWILLVGIMLLITGLLLLLADKAQKTIKSVGFLNSLFIGIAQAVAILPGISRSGATISTSVLLGINRDKAARFSFLMVIPLILIKTLKDILEITFFSKSVEHTEWSVLLIGFAAAFLSGLFACKWMLAIVRNSKLVYFALYCFVIGGGAVFSVLVY